MVWASIIQSRFEDDTLEDWADQLLETFKGGQTTVYVEVSTSLWHLLTRSMYEIV